MVVMVPQLGKLRLDWTGQGGHNVCMTCGGRIVVITHCVIQMLTTNFRLSPYQIVGALLYGCKVYTLVRVPPLGLFKSKLQVLVGCLWGSRGSSCLEDSSLVNVYV